MFFDIFQSMIKTPQSQRYQAYRQQSKKLFLQMQKKYDSEQLMKAFKALGVLKGQTLVIEEEEMDSLLDFTFHDYTVEGKTFVQAFLEKERSHLTEAEITILEARQQASTSLFLVTGHNAKEGLIYLKDLDHPGREISLMDLSFSQSLTREYLLFTRAVPFEDTYTTSGSSFVFDVEKETKLRREIKKMSPLVRTETESAKRFVCFFHLYRKFGIPVYHSETATSPKAF